MDIPKIISETADLFKKSANSLSLLLKIKVAELILNLMRHQKNFGLFVILGWREEWQGYTDISDDTQDILPDYHINISGIENHAEWFRAVESTVGFDGAILIDGHGEIVHSGVILEGLRPRAVAEKVNPGRFHDLSEQFGFKQKVHSRHLFAIASSHEFKNTLVFTVSEETDAFHIFEGGRIIYSTEPGV